MFSIKYFQCLLKVTLSYKYLWYRIYFNCISFLIPSGKHTVPALPRLAEWISITGSGRSDNRQELWSAHLPAKLNSHISS
uniref:Uncharacterized protein n=1 Tax=Anguilla anguilla TaxID=7936 RepID=A0A0E9XMD0_ANGAN